MQSKTKETIKYWYRGLCNLLITVVVIGMFAWVWQHYLNILLYQRYLNKGNLLMIAVYGVLAILFIHVFGGYKIGISKRSNVILSQGIGLVCLNGVGILITILMVGQVYYLRLIIIEYIELLVAQMLSLFVLTMITMTLYRKIFPPYRMLHIYGDYENNLTVKMNARGDKYVIAGELSYREEMGVIRETIGKYDAVLFREYFRVSNKITTLNYICTLGVVVQHCRMTNIQNVVAVSSRGTAVLNMYTKFTNHLCWTDMIFFFMMSGFLLYRNLTSVQDSLGKMRKRLKTLLIPFIVWTCVTIAWYRIYNKVDIITSKKDFANAFFFCPSAGPMWYCLALLLLMLLCPLIAYDVQIILKKVLPPKIYALFTGEDKEAVCCN